MECEGPLDGRIVQRRRLALLALLASSRDRPASRDKLIACLWPESGASQARHSLSDSLHVIHKALGEKPVLAVGDELWLDPEVVSCDVWQFEAALEAGDLERAAGLYAGPFLDGFFIGGDALEFESWAASEGERLARAYLGAVERLAESAATAGEPRQAAKWWRRLCAEDPDNSRAVLGLMEALAAVGDRAGALKRARAHAQHLKSEYGAEPDPTVTALARRLQEEPEVWVPVVAASDSGSAARGARLSQGSLDPVTGDPAEADGALSGGFQRTFAPRQTFLGAAAAAILVLLTAFYFARRVPESEHLTPEEVLAANAAPGIAVLPFTVNDPALDMWREGMVDLLSVNLDGLPDLRAIDSRTLLARWEEAVPDSTRADLATALGVAGRTGARYALLGSVVALGPDLRLTADVYEATGGKLLGHAQVTGPRDSLTVLVDRLTREVLRALPLEGSILAGVDLAEITTESLPALKAYLAGVARFRAGDPGMMAELERAIAIDPRFALAWDMLLEYCNWGWQSELCERPPPGWPQEFLSRLPPRRVEFRRLLEVLDEDPREGLEASRRYVRKYPDDPGAWYLLGDGYYHWGDWALVENPKAEATRAFERVIALGDKSSQTYNHLIEYAFDDTDSAGVAGLVEGFDRIAPESGRSRTRRFAFALGFGDPATRARANAALDTIPTARLSGVVGYLGRSPRLRGLSRKTLEVLLARPDLDAVARFFHIYELGLVSEALDAMEDPAIPPFWRGGYSYRLYLVGVHPDPEGLGPVLAAATDDTLEDHIFSSRLDSPLLYSGAYAVDRGHWDEYAVTLDRQRARAQRFLVEGDSLAFRDHEAIAQALEGYALWKRGRKSEAIQALEAAQRQVYGRLAGLEPTPNLIVRWWLGDLMLEVGRPRDAERYFKSLPLTNMRIGSFAVLRLGRIYEEMGEFEKARESYDTFLAWEDNDDPALRPNVEEARQGLTRLPEPLRRKNP